MGRFDFLYGDSPRPRRGRPEVVVMPGIKRDNEPDGSKSMPKSPDRSKVFVVHGRDENIRKGMFSFLRAIGLEPIEWTQAVAMTGGGAPYVGEVLDAALSVAQAIIVVFTPDDEARLRNIYLSDNDPEHERNLTPQARPNVLFEAGLALGRAPDRTIMVEVGDLRPFSDIGGRHTIRLDNTTQRRQDLANRLQTAGCTVDLSGTDWHTEGDFVLREESLSSTDNTPQVVSSVQMIASLEHKFQEPEGARLEPTAEEILGYLADKGGSPSDLADVIKIHRQVVIYHAELLDEQGYLSMALLPFGGEFYELTHKGRAYLIKNGLLT